MRRPGPGFIAANTLLLWLAMAIAATALWPIYRSTGLVIMVVAAVLSGSLVAVFGAIYRWTAPVVALATIVAFVVLGVPVAVPAKAVNGVIPSLDGLRDLATGVALGWKQLVTITLPVGQYEALLVPFFALILVLTVVSLSTALRARFGELAVLGPVVLFIAAIAFGPTTATWPVALSLGLFAATLFAIIWHRVYRRRRAIRALATQLRDSNITRIEARSDTRFVAVRTVAGAGVILLLAGVTAVGASRLLPPAGARDVVRTSVEQPFEPRDYVSPLSGFRSYWQQPDVDSVMLTAQGLPSGARVRIATLDSYDGIVYSVGSAAVDGSSGSFTRVPYLFDQAGVTGKRVSVHVQVQAYSGVWMPTVGDLENVTFEGASAGLRDSFFYNGTTGTAAVVGGLATGDSYDLTALEPAQPSDAQLASADPGTATVPALGAVPAELGSVLSSYTDGIDGQGNKLVAAIAGLRKNGYISHGVDPAQPASRSGHGVDRINELLTDQRMIGDAEQYSVAAALMARELGFPSRVVMGFVPESAGSGTIQLRGRDISAWIEVDTAQYGWVTIDPNPPVRPIPPEPPKDPNTVARPQSVVPPVTTDTNPLDSAPAPDTQQQNPPQDDPVLALVLLIAQISGWVLVGLLVIASPFLAIIVAKLTRRRRRRLRGTAVQRISGGWQEFEDRVLDHGIQPPAAATRTEVAQAVGGTRTAVLATVADRAVFAPGEPGDDEVALVWSSVRELSASLDRGRSRWQRFRARVSLRSLRKL
ncbi:transglutaminase domain-containing protein [Galbitalea soli]|uniref:Transglutaminase domain-containing protein n=1 Tax=Galbitalea soli TaxID=1268042 RepID=A0A7C9TNY4_9MICO|nr:transglutaminase-like domain-containing protein [Galbitalea soli]NEM90436.1 transglutaminase domain-containing protein [Galbitalea soli]NYJ31148.1 hypothetical protein [Galbitalea soli]